MDSGEEEKQQADAAQKNSSSLVNGVLTVTLYLDQDAGLAKGLGALEMTKDLVKQYCMDRAIREAQAKTRSGIIRPGVVN